MKMKKGQEKEKQVVLHSAAGRSYSWTVDYRKRELEGVWKQAMYGIKFDLGGGGRPKKSRA